MITYWHGRCINCGKEMNAIRSIRTKTSAADIIGKKPKIWKCADCRWKEKVAPVGGGGGR